MYYVIGSILLLIAIIVISIRNSLVQKSIGVKNAFSTMDVFLKKRYDLIPDLVAAVRAYEKHESDTFAKTTEARAKAMTSSSVNDIARENSMINEYIAKIFIIAEKYPELKASENYLKLSEQMVEIEDDIADSRLYYNGYVTEYNIYRSTFPNNIVASLFGYKSLKLFETSEESRSNVNMENL